MSVRTKFTCNSYETSLNRSLKQEPRADGKARSWGNSEDVDTVECRTINLSAVSNGSEENRQFFHANPNGSITIGVLGLAAWNKFELGKEYYVDFVLAEEMAEAVVA